MSGQGIVLPDGRERKRALPIQVGLPDGQVLPGVLPEPSTPMEMQLDAIAKLLMGVLSELQLARAERGRAAPPPPPDRAEAARRARIADLEGRLARPPTKE